MREPTHLAPPGALARPGRAPGSPAPHSLPQDEALGERGHERVPASQPLPGLGTGPLLPGRFPGCPGLWGQPGQLHGGRLRGDPQGQAGPRAPQEEGGQAAEKEVSEAITSPRALRSHRVAPGGPAQGDAAQGDLRAHRTDWPSLLGSPPIAILALGGGGPGEDVPLPAPRLRARAGLVS